MVQCPACRGRGTSAPLHGPAFGYVEEGDPLMVDDGPGYTKCLVTKKAHSGRKLIHDGLWTFRWPDGREETRRCDGRATDMMKVCVRCLGEKEIEPTSRDNQILGTDRSFLVSGKGVIRAAETPEGLWWKYALPPISKSDLLTSEGMVYAVSEATWEGPRGTYQSFRLEERGTTDVSDYILNECRLHGLYEEEACPDCT